MVSIIIAARNELHNLKQLIPNLLQQQYPHFEIIIALDRPEDASEEYLTSFHDNRLSFITIPKVPHDWNAKKYALKSAIAQSKGEWLLLTDADCLPNSSMWINEMMSERHSQTEIILGYSPYSILEKRLLHYYIHFEAFMTGFLYLGMAKWNKPYMGVGRNMAIKKSIYERSGGYEEIQSVLGGDDDLFVQKNANKGNVAVSASPISTVNTLPKATWRLYFQQKIRHLSVGNRYKQSSQLWLIAYHFSHLAVYTFPIFLFKNPLVLGFLLIYLAIKGISYRFVGHHTGDQLNLLWFPVVDLLYAILTLTIAIWSKFEKDIQWTKN